MPYQDESYSFQRSQKMYPDYWSPIPLMFSGKAKQITNLPLQDAQATKNEMKTMY